MKNIITTLVLFFVAFQFAFAQPTKGFSYQTILRDHTRQLIVNQPIAFKMSILEDDANGMEAYIETHENLTTDEFGRVSFIVGNGTSLLGEFKDLDWENIGYYLKVEIDPKGGNKFVYMGAAPLLSVPFADHARTASTALDDHDRDPMNELQELVLNGDTLVITQGNLISLAKYRQTLSLTGNTLSITDGNSIMLDKYAQALQLNGDDLSITNGNAVSLEKYTQELSLSGDTVSLSNGGGNVVLNYAKPSSLALGLDGNYLHIGNWLSYVNLGAFMDSPWTKYSSSRIYYPYQVAIGTSTFSSYANLVVGGSMEVKGGSLNIRSSNNTLMHDLGFASGGGGYLGINGLNGQENFTVSTVANYNNYGYVGVYGPGGWQTVPKARMYIDPSNGKGVLAADVKNFRMEHPKQPGKEIWYACIEGPEAAAYERGTVQLTNGEAFVPYTDHFSLVVNAATVTVILTPLDAGSKGLAVVEKLPNGFRIKELGNGTGSYGIDWEAKGVRQGFENYRVIRNADECLPAPPSSRGE